MLTFCRMFPAKNVTKNLPACEVKPQPAPAVLNNSSAPPPSNNDDDIAVNTDKPNNSVVTNAKMEAKKAPSSVFHVGKWSVVYNNHFIYNHFIIQFYNSTISCCLHSSVGHYEYVDRSYSFEILFQCIFQPLEIIEYIE